MSNYSPDDIVIVDELCFRNLFDMLWTKQPKEHWAKVLHAMWTVLPSKFPGSSSNEHSIIVLGYSKLKVIKKLEKLSDTHTIQTCPARTTSAGLRLQLEIPEFSTPGNLSAVRE